MKVLLNSALILFGFFNWNELAVCESVRPETRGPVFRTEPPARVEFSNSSGAELRCGADGAPVPRLAWLAGREAARDVPGLRHARPDGTLLFPPFGRADYRQDVHDAVYQCVAANPVGSVLSREVHVRAVINQRFDPQVYDDFVVVGNTAKLKCHVPSFVGDYVTVDSWIRNDKQVLKRNDMKGSSFTVLTSGELLIHHVQHKDAQWRFHCQTRHRLTGEMVTSASAGKIVVTESHESTLPKVTFSQPQVRAEEGSFVQLPCVGQGFPAPTYKWLKEREGMMQRVSSEEGRVWVDQGTLSIRKARAEDAGRYQCIARNSIGERRVESLLIVTAPLSVQVKPALQVLNIGQEATFRCNASGYPVQAVSWRKDQRPLPPSSARVRLLSRDVLHIASVRREDSGLYQCFVSNEMDSAQGTAELKISDVPPTLISAFPEQTIPAGESVSLRCVTAGNPLPRITWFLDDSPLAPRLATTEGDLGHVASVLNVTAARPEDGGEYRCKGDSEVGSTFHAARLNVIGPPFVRAMRNVTAVAGEDLTIRCPYGGHPIKGVKWYRNGVNLPLNHRHKVNPGGTLTIQGVQRSADRGQYGCTVKGSDGQVASGSTFVSVVVPPEIDPHYFRESITVEEEARAKLMCVVVRGDPPVRFRWLRNGAAFLAHGDTTVQTFDDTSIVTFRRAAAADRGHYTCVATNVASSTNRTMQLIVNVAPQWTVEPRNTSVVLGGRVWMDCAAVGFPAPSIIWKKLIHSDSNDFAYVHSNPRSHRFSNGTLVLSDVEEEDGGPYLCQASNGIAAGLTKIVALHVLIPPTFKEPFQTKTVTEESNTTLRCIATGHAPIVITWQKDKSLIDISKRGRFSIRDISDSRQTMSELHILRTHRSDTGTYSCSAVSDIGSHEATIHYIVQGKPDAPSNVTVVNVTSRSVTLQWNVEHDGNAHVTGSVVQYQSISESSWNGQTSQLIVSGADSLATLRALTPVTFYFVRVVAENALGHSAPSDVINVTTSEEAPSSSPQEVQVHSTGAQSMKVTWKPPPEESWNGRILGYSVGYRPSSSSESFTFKQVEAKQQQEGLAQSTYITGLQPFTRYDVVVKAFNAAGAGPKSPKITGKTLETAPPTSPTIQVTGSTKASIDIKWEKDSKDKSVITDYTLHYKREADGEWQQERVSREVEHYTLRNLRCGTRYLLYMTASNSLGTGEPGEAIPARTKGAAAVSPPASSFVLANASSAVLHLSAWQSGGCPLRHFALRLRPKHQSQWSAPEVRVDSPRPTHLLSPLAPDREYVLKVAAHSDAGVTQAEYAFRTLRTSQGASSPAKRETDLPFYKNVALVVPVVVSVLVLLMLLFVVCFRKRHSNDRRDYDMRKPCADSMMMTDLGKQITNKAPKTSHYSCPTTGGKGDYAEPYANDSVPGRQGSDGLFATIKRCPTRPIYMPSYKPGCEGPQDSRPSSLDPSDSADRWCLGNGQKPGR